MLFCPLTHDNAERIRQIFPFTAPSPLSGYDATFGTGDRLGIAGPGHIRVFKKYKAFPVLAQQSVRELNLTGSTYENVLDSSTWAVMAEGFTQPWGADGDHLKTEDWVKKAIGLGYTMITADVSDHIHGEFDSTATDSDPTAGDRDGNKWLMKTYGELDSSYREQIEEKYLRLSVAVDTGEIIKFTPEELARTALIYKDAVRQAAKLYNAAAEIKGNGNFDFELSIDETATPTTPQAHLFMALETEKLGIQVSSVAPRFVGEFQKGIDYIGSVDDFKRSFATHAAIARKLGYRISVHSGSDKFSVFPAIGELTQGRFHVKTAGTNWLEALRIISRKDPGFFRYLYRYARENFEKAKKYYHITPNLTNMIHESKMEDDDLPDTLENPDARQVLHVTYGEMLQNPELKEKIYHSLSNLIDDYWEGLENHIGRHLSLLGVKKY